MCLVKYLNNRWIAIIFGTNIHGNKIIIPKHFGDSVTFYLTRHISEQGVASK